MHFVRSISKYSHGVLAPELLNKSLQARGPVAAGDDFVADSLQVVESQIAAVFDNHLEAAGRAEAVDRRCAEDGDDGAAHFLAAALAQVVGDGVG